MTLPELLLKIKDDHKELIDKATVQMDVASCFKTYAFFYRGQKYLVEFNLLTLDFIAKSKMPVSLRSKIKARIIREEYLKWKFKKEGRAFFDFLRLYYDTYEGLIFTDCESPDFIIHNQKHHGYEVTEATDAHNAKFNEAVYLLTGMENHSKEFSIYLKQIQKSLTNKRNYKLTYQIRSIHDVSTIYSKIIECILKKTKKYKEYDVTLDTRNIIVFNNRIGFRRTSDFEAISIGIKAQKEIKASNIDKIIIISGTHDLLVEYNKFGDLIVIKRNKNRR